jgi:hypothetical protein
MGLSCAIDCHLLQGILLVKAEQRRKEGSSVVILCFHHFSSNNFSFILYHYVLLERNNDLAGTECIQLTSTFYISLLIPFTPFGNWKRRTCCFLLFLQDNLDGNDWLDLGTWSKRIGRITQSIIASFWSIWTIVEQRNLIGIPTCCLCWTCPFPKGNSICTTIWFPPPRKPYLIGKGIKQSIKISRNKHIMISGRAGITSGFKQAWPDGSLKQGRHTHTYTSRLSILY